MRQANFNHNALHAFLFVLIWVASSQALASDPQTLDNLTQQWLDIERQTTTLQMSWQEQKPILEQRLALLKAEKSQLQSLLQDHDNHRDEVELKRLELMQKQTHLESEQREALLAIQTLATSTQAMTDLLPPVLQQAWRQEQAALGSNREASQQLQAILAQLSHIGEFNRRVSVHEEVLNSPDGKDIRVKQLFLGVSMAWFTSPGGDYAGWGRASDTGWHWHFDADIDAGNILRAIDMFEKRQAADLVRLPVAITTSAKEDNTQ